MPRPFRAGTPKHPACAGGRPDSSRYLDQVRCRLMDSLPLRDEPPKAVSACPDCGQEFICGVVSGQSDCWCAACPTLLNPQRDGTCLCPTCLARRVTSPPSPTRSSPPPATPFPTPNPHCAPAP